MTPGGDGLEPRAPFRRRVLPGTRVRRDPGIERLVRVAELLLDPGELRPVPRLRLQRHREADIAVRSAVVAALDAERGARGEELGQLPRVLGTRAREDQGAALGRRRDLLPRERAIEGG